MRIGLIINPFAGLGGPAGLKGSDDLPVELMRPGRSQARAERALKPLINHDITFYTAPGVMGQQLCQQLKLAYVVVGELPEGPTSAADSERIAAQMSELKLDLLLFVGGDGTARNVCNVLADSEQVSLGIPAGVKMHSAVYAVNPEAAAEGVLQMLSAKLVDVRQQEVRDIDEQAFRQGQVRSRYYGEMWVPQAGQFIQAVKNSGREVEALVLAEIADHLIEELDDELFYFVGPGSTPKCLLDQLELTGTLLGFDILHRRQLVATDVNAEILQSFVDTYPGRCRAVITAIAGQGHLLGRGNQQLSPGVLSNLGHDGLMVLATKTKISGLQGRPLLIDSDDPELDLELSGHIRVLCGYRDTIYYPLSCGY